MSHRFLAGKIATAHGVKGLVKVHIFTENVQILNGAPLYPTAEGNNPHKLTLKNSMGKFWLAAVDGVRDRNEAEALKGTELWLDRAALPDPKEDEFYQADLQGLTAENNEGHVIGKVIGVSNFGAGDLLEVKPQQGDSFYVVFNKENVPLVDIAGGKLQIKVNDQ